MKPEYESAHPTYFGMPLRDSKGNKVADTDGFWMLQSNSNDKKFMHL